MKIIIIIIIFFSNEIFSREIGETEITTEKGIEVFQKEKYYLLKKNVKIISDTFELYADLVKAYFEEDMYDIINIESEGNVTLKSSKGLIAKGEKINFSTINENILILGKNSSLVYIDINMFSNEYISVNNKTGEFTLKGDSSELKAKDIEIYGEFIDGKYVTINNVNEVEKLFVEDKKQSNIKTTKLNMFSLRAKYNKTENIIELFENVKVVRNTEIITGDYANINTLDESYKVISKEDKKVKVLIKNTDE